MRVQQKADCNITIRRLDNGENISFDKDTIIDVDEETGAYLLQMRCKWTNEEGVEIEAADFIEV